MYLCENGMVARVVRQWHNVERDRTKGRQRGHRDEEAAGDADM